MMVLTWTYECALRRCLSVNLDALVKENLTFVLGINRKHYLLIILIDSIVIIYLGYIIIVY